MIIDERDLTVQDARACARELVVSAIFSVTDHPNILSRRVRDWMTVNVKGSGADRAELQEAVIHLLNGEYDQDFRPPPHGNEKVPMFMKEAK
jgi:hypothetical protein